LGAILRRRRCAFWVHNSVRWRCRPLLLAGHRRRSRLGCDSALVADRFNTSEILCEASCWCISPNLLLRLTYLHGAWRRSGGVHFPQSRLSTMPSSSLDHAGSTGTIAFHFLHVGLAGLSWVFFQPSIRSAIACGYRETPLPPPRYAGFSGNAQRVAGAAHRRRRSGARGYIAKWAGPIGRLQSDISPGCGFGRHYRSPSWSRNCSHGPEFCSLRCSVAALPGGESVQLGLQLPARGNGLFQGACCCFTCWPRTCSSAFACAG